MSDAFNETPMLEETGTVVAVDGQYVVIETQQRSACGHCNVGDSCGTSVLAGLFSKRKNQVRLLNHLNLSEGDLAVIGINESVLLTTAVLAYMLPLLMMIALGVSSSLFGLGDNISFVASILGLFFGMRVSNRMMDNKDYQPREIVLLRNANELPIQFTDKHTI